MTTGVNVYKILAIIILSAFVSCAVVAKNNDKNKNTGNDNCQGTFCEGNNGNHYGQQDPDDYKDEDSSGIGNLQLKNITITPWDITDAKVYHEDQTYEIGSFCAYIDPDDFYGKNNGSNNGNGKKNGHYTTPQLDLIVTNNEGGFVMKRQGASGQSGEVDYNLRINRQDVRYNTKFAFQPEGSNSYNCVRPEYIYITLPAAQLAAAKAGIYDVSLNLSASYY
jgi:hypothetical protein